MSRCFLSKWAGTGLALLMCLAAGCRSGEDAAVVEGSVVTERAAKRGGEDGSGRKVSQRADASPVVELPVPDEAVKALLPLRWRSVDRLMKAGLDAESAQATLAELLEVGATLKERRKAALRGRAIGLEKALDFPAQPVRELVALVQGMRLPEGLTAEQTELIRKAALAEFDGEYGRRVIVTPKVAAPICMIGNFRDAPEVVFQIDADRGIPVLATEARCNGGDAPEWEFDFLVTPELIAAQADAQRDFRARRDAGVEVKTAVKEAVEKAMTGR